jgi:hypothetical protein
MTAKHTPAPWNCYTKGSDIYIEDAKESGIANIRRNFELPFNEKMGNANLIASAPDLLEALIEMVDVHDEDCQFDHKGFCQSHYLDHESEGCRVAKAKEAIAKATGETQ